MAVVKLCKVIYVYTLLTWIVDIKLYCIPRILSLKLKLAFGIETNKVVNWTAVLCQRDLS